LGNCDGAASIGGSYRFIEAWSGGDPVALDRLASLVYEELHRMARHYMQDERTNNTLQTTALVNEVYVRLVDQKNIDWQQRGQVLCHYRPDDAPHSG
jgi:ECF sigma factor